MFEFILFRKKFILPYTEGQWNPVTGGNITIISSNDSNVCLQVQVEQRADQLTVNIYLKIIRGGGKKRTAQKLWKRSQDKGIYFKRYIILNKFAIKIN